jgi:hypothetical protein
MVLWIEQVYCPKHGTGAIYPIDNQNQETSRRAGVDEVLLDDCLLLPKTEVAVLEHIFIHFTCIWLPLQSNRTYACAYLLLGVGFIFFGQAEIYSCFSHESHLGKKDRRDGST